MKARHFAHAFVEVAKRLLAARESQLHVQQALPGGQFLQAAHPDVVAGGHIQELQLAVGGLAQDLPELGPQGFQVRGHAHPGLALGVDQALGVVAERGAASLVPQDEFLPQHRFPLPQTAPHVAVGLPQRSGRRLDRAGAFQSV